MCGFAALFEPGVRSTPSMCEVGASPRRRERGVGVVVGSVIGHVAAGL